MLTGIGHQGGFNYQNIEVKSLCYKNCSPACEFCQAVLPLDCDHPLKVLREDCGADSGQRAEVPGDGVAAGPALVGYSLTL